MNRVEMSGRLIRPPDFSRTQSGFPKCEMTVVVYSTARWDREKDANVAAPNFVAVQAWGYLAEKMQDLPKGAVLYIDGEIDQSEWEDKEGKKKSKTRVRANSFTVWSLPLGEGVPMDADDDGFVPPEEAPF